MTARTIAACAIAMIIVNGCGPPDATEPSAGSASSAPDPPEPASVIVCPPPPFGDVPSSPPTALVDIVAPWVDARPELFAGIWWDGATGEFVFPTISVEEADSLIARDLPADLGYRVEEVRRNADDLEALQRRAGGLSRHGIAAVSARRVWDATVEIGLEILDESSIDAVGIVFAGDLDGICVTGADPADVPPPGPQPTAGNGWRLLADQPERGEVYTVAIAVDDGAYGSLWTALGLDGVPPPVDFAAEIVVHFGAVYSGSCPEIRLDGVPVDTDASIVAADVVQLGGDRICTSDANPRAYLVAIERSALPDPPFTIQLDADCIDCGRLLVTASTLE